MSKANDSGYLFAKMSSAEDNNGHMLVTVSDKKDSKAPIPPTRTFHFEDSVKADERQSFKKWFLDNVMLLVTLFGVCIGVVTGNSFALNK